MLGNGLFGKSSEGAKGMLNLKSSAFSMGNKEKQYIPVYKTKEEAIGDATEKMDAYNKSNAGKTVSDPTKAGFMAYGNQQKFEPITDASRFAEEKNYKGFGVLYRNLDLAENAVDDITALGKGISGSQGNKNVAAYAALAAKLKPMIKRDVNGAIVASPSVVAGDLAQSKYTETM